jgi:geranylgeranyl reductase family protein
MANERDVVVIGAGPAGTAAAITLARSGRRVTVVDKAMFPRDKCCGDGLTTLALRELDDLGLDPAAVPNWCTVEAAWLRSPSGREVRVPLPTGQGIYAATTPRVELDAALVDLASAAGVEVVQGHAVTALHLDADSVVVDVEGREPISASFVVAADGMWSPTRKMLGLAEPGYLGEWHAFRQYARNVTGPAAERLYVWFEPDLLPGYAWSFPLPGGRANIGFGVLRRAGHSGKEMKQLWEGLIERPHIAAALGTDVELEGRHTAWPIPAAVDTAVLSHGRVLFVGDAARATDTMTGEGIGQALLTGRLAAEAIAAAAPGRVDEVERHYRRAVRHHLLADHRMSVVLSRALAHRRGARGAIRLVGVSAWTRRNFARWMFEDEPRAIVLTPSRWHRGFLRRPGAFRQTT